jgi:hypothetical protein
MVRAVFACVIATLVWWGVLSRPSHRARVRAAVRAVSPVTSVEPSVRLLLNDGDRCEHPNCGARAWFRAYYKIDSFVHLCKHHRDEVPDEKFEGAIAVIDERAYVLGGGA